MTASDTHLGKRIYQGDIWFVTPSPVPGGGTVGNEIWSGRPAVIVSNDLINAHAGVVQVVYLTTSVRRRVNATHVPVMSSGKRSIAVCNQVANIDTSRLDHYINHVSVRELREIHDGIALCLGLGGAKPGAALHKWEQLLKKTGVSMYEQQQVLNNDITDAEARIKALQQEILNLAQERDALVTALDMGYINVQMHERLQKVFEHDH